MLKFFKSAALVAASSFVVLGNVYADDCSVKISGNDQLQFDKKEISVPASCGTVKITMEHSGKMPAASMGHNWVLTETANFNPVATAGLSAGLQNNYVPKGDKRVLAATKIIGGGQSATTTVDVSALKGKDLTYFCSFPGHWAVMKGKFVVK